VNNDQEPIQLLTISVTEKIDLIRTQLEKFSTQITSIQLRILGLLYLRPECNAEEIYLSIPCGNMMKFMETPLQSASTNGEVDTARLLLQFKADPNTKNKDGNTPLRDASMDGCVDTSRLLLQFKSDPNIKNKRGYTPLHLTSNHEIKQLLGSDMHVE